MHFVLATFGTDGDVFPFIGLGRELVRAGHEVTLAGSGHYRPAADGYGFRFAEIATRDEIDRVLANPDFWHPLKAGPLAASWGLDLLPAQYRTLAETVQARETVLIGNPGVLAARIVHDRLGTTFASIALQPWLLPSVHRPPVFPGGLALPRRSPRWLRTCYFQSLNLIGDLLVGRRLNAFRGTLGLAPVRRVFDWWFSPHAIFGLFPGWFGAIQPDWPPQLRLAGFPDFDGSAGAALAPELARFLAVGEPPVAITFGTGIRHAGALYRSAVDGCARARRRGIVVSKYPGQIPQPLPDGFVAAFQAPFSKLFPQCAAVIHHGGIGTTAQALRARVPQIIVPVCFDQLDNARRVQELGCGTILSQRRAVPAAFAESLGEILGKPVPGFTDSERPAFQRVAEMLENLFAPGGMNREFAPAVRG